MRARRNRIMALVLSVSMSVSTIFPSAAVYAEDYDAAPEMVGLLMEDETEDYADDGIAENEELLAASEEEALLEEDENSAPSGEAQTISQEDFEDDEFWEELFDDDEEMVDNTAASDRIAYSGENIGFYKEDGISPFRMLSPQDGSAFVLDGDEVKIYIIPSNTTIYGWLHWGLITDEELTKDVALQENGYVVLSVDKENCGYGLPVAPIKKSDGAPTRDQYYLCIPAEENLAKSADYTAVNAALAKVPADLAAYTNESAKAVTDAVNAVFRYKSEAEQADVDAMAKAIEDAVAALEEADEKVAVTFSAKSNSTEELIENAVFSVTDAEGNAIEASDGKYTLTVGASYKVAVSAPDYRSNTVTYTARADESEHAFGLYKLNYNYTLQVCLAARQYAESTPAGTNRGEVVTIQKEGEEPRTVTTTASNYTLDHLEPGATYTIRVVWPGYDVISSEEWSVEKHGYYFETDGTTEWTFQTTIVPVEEGGKEHIDNLIVRFIEHEEEAEVDFTAVNAALAAVPGNLRLFTSESADAVRAAVNAVDRESKSQEDIDAMASAITTALQGLVPKDGTYEVTIDKYNSTPYYLYEGLGDSDKASGKAILSVEGGRMSAQLLLKNQSYGQVYPGTQEEASDAAKAAGGFPQGTIEITLNSEQSTVNGKSYKSSSVTVPVSALQKKVDYAYHSSNTARYDHTTGWYPHSVMYLANSLVPIEVEQQDETIRLSIYNEEQMFKVVNAFVEIRDGKAEFVFCLSATGYQEIFAGTYEEAMANGNNKENWIRYTPATVECVYETRNGKENEGTAEKYQFRVPITLGNESVIRVPIVAISHTRQVKAENANPENPDYSAAFTARQALIDLNAGTVRTGNYKDEFAVTVASNVETFAVEEAGVLETTGTPLANEYTCQPTITMKDNTYDKAFIGSAENAEKAADSAWIPITEDKRFVIRLQNSLNKTPQIKDGKATVAFRVAATEKWIERTFTIDTDAKTVTIDGEEIADSDYEIIRLSIYDEEAMFKVVNAYIEKRADKAELVFCLSSTGYEEVFAGTYEEAIANGNNKENWIRYTLATVDCVYETGSGKENAGTAEKYQFRVPITLGDENVIRVPIVAISHTRQIKAENANPENPDYSAAFTARQAVINIDERSVRTGNYQDTAAAAVTSNIKSMKVEAAGEIFTIGTPQANEYTCQLTFMLSDTTYDAYFKENAEKAAAEGAAAIPVGEDGKVTLTYKNSLGKTPEMDIKTGKVTAAFRVAETGAWIDREITVNPEAKTITIDGEELKKSLEPFAYDGNAVTFIDAKGGPFSMFSPQEGTKAEIVGENVVIRYAPKNTTIYGWFHWGATDDAQLTKDVTLDEDGIFTITLSKENCGWALPVAPIKRSDDTATTSTQFYLAIPAEDKLIDADYAAVDAALARVPADLSGYTDETAKAVEDAVAAVDRTKKACEQEAVDAMAKAIEDAVAALQETVIPALGHKLVKTAAKAATTGAAGNIEYYTCSVCGKLYADAKGTKEIRLADTVIAKLPNPEGDVRDKTSVAGAEKEITSMSDTAEPTGSSFAKIQVKSTKQTKNSITVSWNKVKGATGYIVYGNKCGKKVPFLRLSKQTKTSYTYKKLKKGTYYKFSVVAYKTVNGQDKVIASGKTIHVATKGGKVTNISRIKLNAKKKTLKKGATFQLKATTVKQSAKLKVKTHRKVKYESSNPKVATVSKKGKIKAKQKGTCTIYVYSQNGTYAKVKITVK